MDALICDELWLDEYFQQLSLKLIKIYTKLDIIQMEFNTTNTQILQNRACTINSLT